MIDTHCHLTAGGLRNRLQQVIDGALEAGVDRMITIGTTVADSAACAKLAAEYPSIFFTAGIQPHDVDKLESGDIERIIELARRPRCVALGEMGLEYHYPDPPGDVQRDCFERQLQAIVDADIDKPVVIHCREAVDDTLAIIGNSGLPADRFVFHCHTEPPGQCRTVLDAGCWISFTGIVTYKNAAEVRDSAKLVPLDRLMVETDAPYLTPEPHRGHRPNEPRFVVHTAAYLAELHGQPTDRFIERLDGNAERFFRLTDQTNPKEP